MLPYGFRLGGGGSTGTASKHPSPRAWSRHNATSMSSATLNRESHSAIGRGRDGSMAASRIMSCPPTRTTGATWPDHVTVPDGSLAVWKTSRLRGFALTLAK